MFRTVPVFGADQRVIAEVVRGIMDGKTNNTGLVTLATGGATTTVINDERIGGDSKIILIPYSLSAAASNNYPYGSFEERADITFATANAPQVLSLTTADFLVGVSLAANKITVAYSGVYDLTVSGLFVNQNVQIQESFLWLRVNGTDVPHTATKFSVVESHGGTDGYLPVSIHHPLELNADDYVEVVAAVDNTNVYLEAYAAQTTPFVMPAIPSLMVNLKMLDPSQTAGTAHEAYVSSVGKTTATITHFPNIVENKTYAYVVVG